MGRKKRKFAPAPQNFDAGTDKTNVLTEDGGNVDECLEELVVRCDYWAAHYIQQYFLYESEKRRRTEAEKKLLEERDACRKEADALREKLTKSEDEIRYLRERTEREDGQKLAVSEAVGELLSASDEFALMSQRLWKENSQLRTRIAWLDAQNQRYQRFIARLTGTWYGKILRGFYHLFQKFGWI